MPYDIEYWDKMLRQNSSRAEEINQIRWDFVKDIDAHVILDYGSGPGWFRAFKPEGIIVDTYDIAPWPQTGIKRDQYDLVTFWDVVEHFKDLQRELDPILKRTKWFAGTLPVLKKDQNLKNWKHYKPGEHHQYFSEQSFITQIQSYGWKLFKKGYPECPPRDDILSFIFRKGEDSIY